MSVHIEPWDTEQLEYLQILFLCELFWLWFVVEATCQILHYLLVNKIGCEKLVAVEELLYHWELAGDISCDYVLEDELEPFWDVHLEEHVFSY